MQLNHATQELDNMLSNVLSSFDGDKIKGQSKNIGDVMVNVVKQCGNLTVNIAIGAVYGVGTTAFLMFVYPFRLFYRRVFKRQIELTGKTKVKV